MVSQDGAILTGLVGIKQAARVDGERIELHSRVMGG